MHMTNSPTNSNTECGLEMNSTCNIYMCFTYMPDCAANKKLDI